MSETNVSEAMCQPVYRKYSMKSSLTSLHRTISIYLRRHRSNPYLFMQTADEIAEIGHKLDNPIVMGFILNGLPDSYRYLVVNLESQLEEISIQDLSARLVDEEIRIRSMASEVDGYGRDYQAALARKQACKHCGKDNHPSERCFRNMERCEYCGKSGHDEDDCYTKQFREKKKKGGKSSGGKTEPYGMVMAYESDG